MKTLVLSTNTFDRLNTFSVRLPNGHTIGPVSLHRDYQKQGDGVYWALLHASVLANSSSQEEIDEAKRIKTPEYTICHDEIVLIENTQYKVNVLGRYSECATFKPLT